MRPVVTFVRPACPSFLHARSDPISATREIARTESEPTGVANLAELHPAESNKVARDNAVAWHCVCIADDLTDLGLHWVFQPQHSSMIWQRDDVAEAFGVKPSAVASMCMMGDRRDRKVRSVADTPALLAGLDVACDKSHGPLHWNARLRTRAQFCFRPGYSQGNDARTKKKRADKKKKAARTKITRRRTQLTIQIKATYRLTRFGRHSFGMPASSSRDAIERPGAK